MDIDDLKPCPFCGGEASTEREGDRRASHIIACTECGARMETGETGDQRGNAWNTRPTEDAMRERVKVLEGAARELADALDAVDREAERAEQPGATAWSSAPAVRLIHAKEHVRVALKDAEAGDK